MTVEDPIDMAGFCDTVHQWFSEATGLTTIWRDQGTPQPAMPYGSLSIISGPTRISPHWEQRHDYDESRPEGEEIELAAVVPCRIVVSCQAYVGLPDARNPGYDALNYINKAQAALGLDSYMSRFLAKKISVWGATAPARIPTPIYGVTESRYNLDVNFQATLSAVEYVGYIETAQVISEDLGIDETIGVGV
jgi:hypothetical protein